jgi:hypothetical protein
MSNKVRIFLFKIKYQAFSNTSASIFCYIYQYLLVPQRAFVGQSAISYKKSSEYYVNKFTFSAQFSYENIHTPYLISITVRAGEKLTEDSESAAQNLSK